MNHEMTAPAAPEIAFDQWLAVDIRVGTIIAAQAALAQVEREAVEPEKLHLSRRAAPSPGNRG